MASNPAGQTPLAVAIKPDVHVVATQINAIGGAPLAGTLVQLVDPETAAAEGDPVRTDDQGKVLAVVSENKPYDLKILDGDGAIETPGPQQNPPIEEQLRLSGIYVRVLDAGRRPRAGVAFKVKGGPSGIDVGGTTDAEGDVTIAAADAGAYDLEVDGKTLKVHTVYARDLKADPTPYRIVVG